MFIRDLEFPNKDWAFKACILHFITKMCWGYRTCTGYL